MTGPEASEWWNPLFAIEALRAIKAKCESGEPLEQHERAYLAEAISRLLAEYERHKSNLKPMRADRALGLVLPQGQHAQTLSDRNIRVYNRAEELRELSPGRSLAEIFADVAEEANQGNFDSPKAAGENPSERIAYADSSYRNGVPARTATSPENIEKIYRAVAAIFGK